MAALQDMPLHLAGRTFERTFSAGLSRAELLRKAAVAGGGVAGLGLLTSQLAFAGNRSPRPIPGGFDENFNSPGFDRPRS